MWCSDWEASSHLAIWPESKRLKSALKERRKGTKYTMPGLKHDVFDTEVLEGPMKEILKTSFKKIDMAANQEALASLVDAREHQMAVAATGQILTLLGHGMETTGRSATITPYALEIWTFRFQLLLGLKKHKELLDELSTFEELDAPDLFFQYHDDNKKGSMVPFSLRMIHSEALVYSPLPKQALARICRLVNDTELVLEMVKGSTSPSHHVDCWRKRLSTVTYLKIRLLHILGESQLVLDSVEEIHSASEDNDEKRKLSLLLCRLHLNRSEQVKAENALQSMSDSQSETMQHKSFLSIAAGDAKKMAGIQMQIKSDDQSLTDLNNLAVSKLYIGKPTEAADILINEARRCISSKTRLHPSIALNLKTIIDVALPAATKSMLHAELASVLPQ